MTPEELARRALECRFLGADDLLRESPGEAPAGPSLLDRYELLERLGEGGSGEVFRARERSTGREVALKRIPLGRGRAAGGAEDRARFGRELDALVKLRHPGIPVIYDAGIADGCGVYVMERVDGESLERHLERARPALAERVRLVEEAARIAQFAHEHGFVHRDLKPGNLLVGRDGAVRVVDFGLAKPLDDEGGVTAVGSVLGTPQYMAPEQADGQVDDVDARSDVFALGAILYRALAGRPPFTGPTLAAVLSAIWNDPPPPLRAADPDVPVALEAIVLRALEKDPARRTPTAQAFADELRQWRAGAGKSPDAPASPRRIRRAGRVAAASAVVLLGLWAANVLFPTAPPRDRRADGDATPAPDPRPDEPKEVPDPRPYAPDASTPSAGGPANTGGPAPAAAPTTGPADPDPPAPAATDADSAARVCRERALARWDRLLPDRVPWPRNWVERPQMSDVERARCFAAVREDVERAVAAGGKDADLARWLCDLVAFPLPEEIGGLAAAAAVLVRADPDRAPLLQRLMGDVLLAQQQFDAAVSAYRDAIGSAPRDPRPLAGLCLALTARALEGRESAHESRLREESLAALIALEPGHPHTALALYRGREPERRRVLESGSAADRSEFLQQVCVALEKGRGAAGADPIVAHAAAEAALDLGLAVHGTGGDGWGSAVTAARLLAPIPDDAPGRADRLWTVARVHGLLPLGEPAKRDEHRAVTERALRTLAELAPGHAGSRLFLGDLLAERGAVEEALREWGRAETILPALRAEVQRRTAALGR